MGKPSAPKPPDPKQTSAAATGTNVATATANAYLGNINEITPDGQTNVSRTGWEEVTDPFTGVTSRVPTFTRTTTLSAAQQAIKDQQDRASLNLSRLGGDLSGTLGQQLTGNFKLGNEAVEARLFELGRNRLDPLLAQQDDALRTRLANQGIKAGSAAYDREMANQNQSRNDAYNQLLLTGRGQASQELLTEDNQRINQISALLNGGQVSQPNFMGANMPTIPTTDTAGIINENFNQRMNIWNQKMAGSQNLLGGLFGLGSALIMSDRDTKTDIEKIGTTDDNLPIYSYRYKAGGPRHIGLMAQDVEKKKPGAVREVGGIKHIDYEKAYPMGRIFAKAA